MLHRRASLTGTLHRTGKTQKTLKRIQRNADRPLLTKFCYEGRMCNILFDACDIFNCMTGHPAIDHVRNTQVLCKNTCLVIKERHGKGTKLDM